MAFSVPVPISIVGDARMVRNVYRPATPSNAAQTYITYVAEIQGITRLIIRSTIGVDLSEVTIPVDIRGVDSYSVVCHPNDLMIVAWSDGTSIRKFLFDLKDPTATITQTVIAQGINPELSEVISNRVQIFYTRNTIVYRRVSFNAGSTWSVTEKTISDPSNTTFDRYGTSQQPNTTKFNYLVDIGFGPKQQNGVALPFTSDGNTTLLLNGTNLQTELLTEAAASGTTNYYTMNDAQMSGSTILDSVGGIVFNLDAGTNNSTTGKVSQARSFNGSTRWRTPSTGNLNFAGDLTIRFWVKINTYGVYHHPVGRAYGAEYGFIIGPAGYIYVYWGSSGGFAPPYQGIGLPDGTIKTNTWYHVAYTRDMTARVARLYIDGVLRVQDQVYITPVASGQYTYLGWSSWTNHFMQGAIDELVFNTVALTPMQIKLSYEKGLASTADNISASTSAQVFKSTTSATTFYKYGTIQQATGRNQTGIEVVEKNSRMYSQPSSQNKILLAGASTIELWAKVGNSNSEDDNLLDVISRDVGTDINGGYSYVEGAWSVGFQNNYRLRFSYIGALQAAGTVTVTQSSVLVTGSGTKYTSEFKPGDYVKFSTSTTIYQISSIASDTSLNLTGTYALTTQSGVSMWKVGKHNLIQTTPAAMYKPVSFNYYGLSIDGTISGTILVLNGYRMKTYWHVDVLNVPVATPLNWALRYTEGPNTILDSLKVSNVAKTLNQMRNYFKGTTL